MIGSIIKNFKRLNTSVQSIIFVLTIVILFSVIVSQALSIVQLKHEIHLQEQNVEQAENTVKVLTEKLEKTTTESYIEETAREKFGMVKTGETPIQITEVTEVIEEKENLKAVSGKDKTAMYLKAWYEQLNNWFVSFGK